MCKQTGMYRNYGFSYCSTSGDAQFTGQLLGYAIQQLAIETEVRYVPKVQGRVILLYSCCLRRFTLVQFELLLIVKEVGYVPKLCCV